MIEKGPAARAAPSSEGAKKPSPTATPTPAPVSPAPPVVPETPPVAPEPPIDYSDPYNCLPFRVRSKTPKLTETLEKFHARRKKAEQWYPEDMLLPDGTPNWGGKELWDYDKDSHHWLVYEVLFKESPISFADLVKRVLALGKERTPDVAIDEDEIREDVKGILRGEPSFAPPGFGKLVSEGPAPGKLRLVYDPKVAVAGWNKLRRPAPPKSTAKASEAKPAK